MTDTTDIKALREAAMKATAGEWCTDSQHSVIADAGLNENYYVAACSGPDSKVNAKFISLANPSAIIALLDQLEAERQNAHHYRTKWKESQNELAARRGTQEPVAKSHKGLGEVQLGVLRGLKEHKGWKPRCGWVWGNTARTLKIVNALLKKDLVSSGPNELFTINKKGLAAIEAAGIVVKDGE